MPLYLATEKHWSTTEYSLFDVFYGICGFLGLCVVGWLIDRIGRRRTFILTLIEGAIFMTLWVYCESHVLLWTFGLAWSLGFLGFWGPSTTLTAEVFPTRIRGAANGFGRSPTSSVSCCSRSSPSRRSSTPARSRCRSSASLC